VHGGRLGERLGRGAVLGGFTRWRGQREERGRWERGRSRGDREKREQAAAGRMAGAAATGKMATRVRMLGLMGLRLVSFFYFFLISKYLLKYL
jgi:hypothetical protein